MHDIASIKRWLSENFWLGKRWLCFDSNRGLWSPEDLKCFGAFQEAANYCDVTSTICRPYKIKVLGDTLKKLNAGLSFDRTNTSHHVLRELLQGYSIASSVQDGDLFEQLITGWIYPVVWNKMIHPLKAIQTYFIIDRKIKVKQSQDVLHSYKIYYQHERFESVIGRFHTLVKTMATPEDDIHDYILVGELNGRKIQFEKNGELKDATGLLLYATSALDRFNEATRYYQPNEIMDVTNTTVSSSVVFCRFIFQKAELFFFDGNLRGIMPGELIESINLIHYDFEESINEASG